MVDGVRYWRFLIAAVLGAGSQLTAQMLLNASAPGSAVRIFNTDMAVFEAGEARKDLPCDVVPSKPELGFDLRFHTGYDIVVPMRDLAGAENLLTVLFRVSEQRDGTAPIYFSQKIKVPLIDEDSKGDAYIFGAFDVGEGRYHVDWLMRDRTQRVCASGWDFEAALPAKDKPIELAVGAGVIQPCNREQFKDEPPVARVADEPLSVKMLINFAPQKANSATMQPIDTAALISILRGISRDPRVGKFSLVAFNLQEQRVLFRQDNAEKIDFPALGEAVSSVNPGVVDLQRLSQKKGEVNFLSDLIRTELSSGGEADAVVFAGPKALVEDKVPQDSLKDVGSLASPVFYMNYNLYPQQVPWTDAIGKAVKYFNGYEYTISQPRDLWFAVNEVVTRIVKLKHIRHAPTSSSE